MSMFTVTITDQSNNQKHQSRHRGADSWQAVDKAVKKRWGKRAWFHRDNGISVGAFPTEGTQYGQVCEPIKSNPGVHNCITGRVSVRAE